MPHSDRVGPSSGLLLCDCRGGVRSRNPLFQRQTRHSSISRLQCDFAGNLIEEVNQRRSPLVEHWRAAKVYSVENTSLSTSPQRRTSPISATIQEVL